MEEIDLNLCTFHDSPLKSTKTSSKCEACYEDHHDNKQGYKCDFCEFYVHEECINTSIPSRHKHPLKLRGKQGDLSCCLCETELSVTMFYHCSKCSFRICVPCARKPLMIHQYKAHKHELHQIPINISFTCEACGLLSTGYPYICHQCCFIIHRACIFLPRVIYINYHDHRISYVSSLGPGKWTCGVCDESVNGEYGAFSCLVCSFTVHSNCATKWNVWDGRELEGVLEEEDEKEESKPFQVIDQNLIKHFSHEHNLKMSVPREEEDKRCYACTLPLYSELCYKCTQCGFILHDACANLPRKKRYFFFTERLTLCHKDHGHYFRNFFFCEACKRYCNGFSYSTDSEDRYAIDVRCASMSIPFKHESHPHWLVLCYAESQEEVMRCEGCDLYNWYILRCKGNVDCGGIYLCFTCVTLPTLVRHGYDNHPLSLYYGDKNVSSTYWCGICEEEINSKTWFYNCNDCGSTLHTKCVFKNLIRSSRPGYSSIMGNLRNVYFIPNNRLSRPICFLCKTRCVDDLVLNMEETKLFLCYSCSFSLYQGTLSLE
ncbi:uncharacterized protein LOC18022450 [Eutrema salsugineum]|nr:uncharacterized protein LOC18022450 [Eutrema salsugineum]